MKSFLAFFKKEFLDSIRSHKVLILIILFTAFGIMNPAIAKLTPWLLEIMAEELADSGMNITVIEVDAFTSWQQFYKNIPMALIAFVFIYSNIFTKEYESGTLILMLTKGLKRYKVVLSKLLLMLIMWTLGYYLCFGVTYIYTAYYWDNSIVNNLLFTSFNWYLFGVFVISLVVLFSVIFKNISGVLLNTSFIVIIIYIISLIPRLTNYMPTSLMNAGSLMIGIESYDIYIKTIIITLVLSLVSNVLSILLFNKKEI